MSNVENILIWQRSALLWLFLFSGIVSIAQPAPDKRRVQVDILTEMGTITVELYNETPIHRDNFISLVKSGHYDSLLFHRVIPGFMIQGGDKRSRNAPAGMLLGEDSTETTIPAEIVPGLINSRGSLAAARDGDDINPERRSASSQFYIVQGKTYQPADLDRLEERNARMGDGHKFSEAERQIYATQGGAAHLDGAYTVFGKVVSGMEVVDAIAAMPTDGNDRPLKDIRMHMRVK